MTVLTHNDKIKAILHIRPNAEFVLRDDELEWLDKNQTKPTDLEIQNGWLDYLDKLQISKIEAEKKREALLNKLGITADEAKLLLQ